MDLERKIELELEAEREIAKEKEITKRDKHYHIFWGIVWFMIISGCTIDNYIHR